MLPNEMNDSFQPLSGTSSDASSRQRPIRLYTTQASIVVVTLIELGVAAWLLLVAIKAETVLRTILATSAAVVLIAALLVTQRIILQTNKSVMLWKSALTSTIAQEKQPQSSPPPARTSGAGRSRWELNIVRTQLAIVCTVGVETLLALGFLYFSTQQAYASVRYFFAGIGVIILMAALLTTEYVVLQTHKEVDEFITKTPQQFVGDASFASFKRLYGLSLEIHRGLNQVKTMYWVQFVLGIALILASIAFYVVGQQTGNNQPFLTGIFGASGAITLVSTFITTPPASLQKNRVDLSQWMIAYTVWTNTFFKTTEFMPKDNDGAASSSTQAWNQFKEYNNYLLEKTADLLRIIEDTCEAPSQQSSKNKDK
jgi:hypothetical protein